VVQDQKLAYCNLPFARILGYAAAAELTGTDVLSLPVEQDAAAVADALRRASEEGADPVRQAFAALRKDGAVIALEMQGARSAYLGRPAVVGMIQEIAENARAALRP
jgi:PAS domain S-box-containing protein